MDHDGLIRDTDGTLRCWWPGDDALYRDYHDDEWGRPVADDLRLFEKLCLEGFQAGLSWLTILRKRPAFREAFEGFEPERVARFDRRRVERLMGNQGIVRNRAKIEATVNNARRLLELLEAEGSFASYVWRWEPTLEERPVRFTKAAFLELAKTPSSTAMSRDLKKRGFSFVGPTTVYAFMQAMGLVNDHVEGCAWRPVVDRERRAFRRP